MRTYGVEEVTVVAYYEHGVFEVGKVFFEPGHCFHIEVIGRLIQQQVVRISVQGLCQHHTYLFLTAQLTHQCIMLVFLNAQSAQQHGRVTLRVPSVQLGKTFFQFGNFQSVFVCEIFFGIQHFALFHYVPQHGMTHHYGIHYGKGVPLEVILAQYGEAFAGAQGNRTGSGIQIPVNRAEECRFSRTVRTDNTIAITTRKLQVYVIKQHSFTKLYRNIRNCNHLTFFYLTLNFFALKPQR